MKTAISNGSTGEGWSLARRWAIADTGEVNSRTSNLAGAFVLPLLVAGALTRAVLFVTLHLQVHGVVLSFSPIIIGLGVGLFFASRVFPERMILWLAYCPLMAVALWLAMAVAAVLTVGIVV